MDEEDEHSPSEFSIILNIRKLLIQKPETGLTESQEAIDDFINQQKSANTNKKKATDMTKKPSWNFRINNCFCQIPLKSFFEVLFKLM